MNKDLVDFFYAIETSNLKGVQAGLTAGIDPNSGRKPQERPLLLAIRQSSEGVINTLLDGGAKIEKIWEGQTQAETFRVLRQMLSIQVPTKLGMKLFLGSWPKKFKTWDSNWVNNFHHPLHVASRHYSSVPNAIECLIEHGANPDVVDGYGRTPAHVCIAPEVIKVLSSFNARCDIPDGEKCTPLWRALGGSENDKVCIEKVRALLDAGVNPCIDPKARHIHQRAQRFLTKGVPGSRFTVENKEVLSRLCDAIRPFEARKSLQKTAQASRQATRSTQKRPML